MSRTSSSEHQQATAASGTLPALKMKSWQDPLAPASDGWPPAGNPVFAAIFERAERPPVVAGSGPAGACGIGK